jgi:quercetin dioxygenase-like cupin family protein
MNRIGITLVMATFIGLGSCNQSNKTNESNMTERQNEIFFSKGNKIISDNFTGTAWLQMMVSDSTYNTVIGNVTFEKGARTSWHYHPGGQILLVTNGAGYYQEKGKPIKILHKGDIVICPPDTEHWHGASPDCGLTHIAISTNLQKGNVVWLKPVSDEEYNIIKMLKSKM